jgi:DNA-binding NarL/FixJ family response regulator
MYRVLLVDDQPLFRDIARSMFGAAGGFEVVAEAGDGAEAVDVCRFVSPSVVLTDVQMPRMNGFEAARRITRSKPGTVVVITSMRPEPEYPRLAEECGAAAFFSKRDLDVQAIRAILDARHQYAAKAA